MTATVLAATVLATAVILFPVALVWFPTIGGLVITARERRRQRATAKAKV